MGSEMCIRDSSSTILPAWRLAYRLVKRLSQQHRRTAASSKEGLHGCAAWALARPYIEAEARPTDGPRRDVVEQVVEREVAVCGRK